MKKDLEYYRKKYPNADELFFVNDFQRTIWNDNYRGQDKDIVETIYRIANAVFGQDGEDIVEKAFDSMINRRLFFGGRTTANAGTNLKNVHVFNCYAAQRSVKPVDSILNIYEDLRNAAEILKTEGGQGYNFSHIRPRGTLIKGVGVGTPGVVSFMDLYNASADVITKGNPGEIFQAPDGFPIKRKIRKGAQMGMLHCFSGDTEIATDEGWVPIKKIVTDILSLELTYYAKAEDGEYYEILNPFSTTSEQLYEVVLENGTKVRCTEDHRFEVAPSKDSTETQLKELSEIDLDNEYFVCLTEENEVFTRENVKCKSVKPCGVEETFDFEVDTVHRIIARAPGCEKAILTSNCAHPDVEEFITAKRTPGRLDRFNISVIITDEFMECLEQDKDWELWFPDINYEKYDEEWDGDFDKWKSEGKPRKVYKAIPAKELWDKIIQSTYNYNEPGIYFIDNANRYNNILYHQKVTGTNPCVHPDTLILTNRGWITIKNLTDEFAKDKDIKVITQNENNELESSELHFVGVTKKNDKVLRVSFSNGEYQLVNHTHKFYDESFKKKEISEFKVGDKIAGLNQLEIVDIEETDIVTDVYDVTVTPNFNFFAIMNREEDYSTEQIVVNDFIKFYQYDLVKTQRGTVFACDLKEGDELL